MLRLLRRASLRRESRPESYYRWEDPQGKIRIDLSLEVVEKLRPAIAAASTGQGVEIGGLLLGRRGDPVRVDAFQIIECEHYRGPSYTLTSKEKKAFAKRIEKTRGQDVVGYFRSHTRAGIYLDQEDFVLMQSHLADPSQVVLVVKPWGENGQIAGFFFWEEGNINRHATYHQFPFESAELGPRAARPAAEAPPAVAMAVPEPAPLPPLAGPAPARHSRKMPRLRPVTWAGAAALAAVALTLGALTLLPRGGDPAPEPAQTPGNDIALNVNKSQGGVRVSWNQNSQTLAAAGGATLRIDDGGQERVVSLDERQIRTGSITYLPATDSVTVRLDPGVQTASAAPPEAPAPMEELKPPPAQLARRARPKPAPKRFVADGLLAKADHSPQSIAIEAPPQLSSAMLPRMTPAVIPHKSALPRAVARITWQPVKPNAMRKVVNKIPGLRLLQRRQYRNADEFKPAKPLRAGAPDIPSGVPAQPPPVELKILIDNAGEVQRAEVVSKRSVDNLEDLALSAVQSWKFDPARLENEPVESEMRVHFDFGLPTSAARTTQPK